MGCTSGTQQIKPSYPSSTLVECKERTLLTEGSLRGMLLNHVQLASDYEECRTRHNTLVRYIKNEKTDSDIERSFSDRLFDFFKTGRRSDDASSTGIQ